MKGLLIKDFFCLKKQLVNYGFIIVGVIVISIMFVLSYNFGNVRAGFTEMIGSSQAAEADINMIAGNALLLFIKWLLRCRFPSANGWHADLLQAIYLLRSVWQLILL